MGKAVSNFFASGVTREDYFQSCVLFDAVQKNLIQLVSVQSKPPCHLLFNLNIGSEFFLPKAMLTSLARLKKRNRNYQQVRADEL